MSTYDTFTAAFHELMTRDPNACVQLGVERGLDQLPDPSLAAIAREAADAQALIAHLREIPAEGLSASERLDLELAEQSLALLHFRGTLRFNEKTTAAQLPSAGDDISNGIFGLFVNDPRPAAARLQDITARVSQIPGYVTALLGRLDTPVARWVKMDIEKVEGLPELFATVRAWAEQERWPGTPGLVSAIASAETALHGYLAALRGLPTTKNLHLAEEDARRLVALRGIDLPFEELRQIAEDFLARTRAQLETLRARLVEKYQLPAETSADQLGQFLKKRYQLAPPGTPLETILESYQAEREKLLAFIQERDLFPIPAEQDLKIIRTPSFLAPSIPAGAMQPPAPFRGGVRTSIIYLTLSEELRDEHSALDIPGMMLHEGIPGHHLQLAYAAMHPSVIRRHINALDQAEGWTTMLEDYLLDQGYAAEIADEVRFCTKRDLCRIGARVAIDLFLMTGKREFLDVGVPCDTQAEDPFVAAANLLSAVTDFAPGRVEAELNWYSQERGYPLSYLAGNHLVWSLKRKLQAAHAGTLEGQDFDRAFHRAFLQAGNMPVRFLHHAMFF